MTAFDRYYAENYEVVKGFINRRVRNIHDAEDIAQEVFLIFNRTLDETKHPKTYLFTIARTKTIDFFRRKKVRKDNVTLSSVTTEDFHDPDAGFMGLGVDLSDEMKMLVEGHTYQEIADKFSVSKGKVLRRIHAERKALKRKVYNA